MEEKKENQNKYHYSFDEKFESIDQEINYLYKLIENLKMSSLAYVVDKLGNYADRVDEKLKIALQDKLVFHEETVDTYQLEDAISWFKEHYVEIEDLSGGLFKVESQKRVKIYHFFLKEEDKKVMTGKKFPLKLVKTGRIDTALQNQFGEEDLILFR